MSNTLEPPSPTDETPPPPAYSDQEFDRKTRAVVETSLATTQLITPHTDEEGWEEWDETLYEANAVRQAGISKIRDDQSSVSNSPSLEASRKALEAAQQAQFDALRQASSSYNVQPLNLRKKPKSPPVNVPSSSRSPGPDSQGASMSPRRQLPSAPGQSQVVHNLADEQEGDRSVPPPPFAIVDNSLDGPPYQRYSEQGSMSVSQPEVILRYTGRELSASPPPSPLRSPTPESPSMQWQRGRMASPVHRPLHLSHQNDHAHQKPRAQSLHRNQFTQSQYSSQPPLPPQTADYVYSMTKAQAPRLPRLEFNPSMAYANPPSPYGELPNEPLARGDGAMSLYNSAVIPHLSNGPRQHSNAPKQYTESIATTHGGEKYDDAPFKAQPQNYYASQFSQANRSAIMLPFSQTPNLPQYPSIMQQASSQQFPVQYSLPQRPLSSLSQGDHKRLLNQNQAFQNHGNQVYYQS